MDNYRTEEEQVEALKRWWEKNGKLVIVFGIVFVAAVVGGRVWMDFKRSSMEKVSSEYDLMMQEMQAENAESAMRRGAMLMEQHKDTPYAGLAALAVAKMEVEKGDLSSAELRLKWAMDNSTLDETDHIARLRLIRVLIEEAKLDQAMEYANIADTGNFKAEYDMLKGDIYSAQGHNDQAISSYQAALSGEGLSQQTQNELRLKIDNLGGANS